MTPVPLSVIDCAERRRSSTVTPVPLSVIDSVPNGVGHRLCAERRRSSTLCRTASVIDCDAGAAIAALYGALYALLQLEQTALLLGSTMLFAVVAALMVATRRIDWYGLFARMRAESATATPDAAAPAAA